MHATSDWVRNLSMGIGFLEDKSYPKVVQVPSTYQLLTKGRNLITCGFFSKAQWHVKDYCLGSSLGVCSYLGLPFSSIYMDGSSWMRHCFIISLVLIQGITSQYISITSISTTNMGFHWQRSSSLSCRSWWSKLFLSSALHKTSHSVFFSRQLHL